MKGILSALIVLAFASQAKADGLTGSLTLSGVIPTITTIDVDAVAGSDNLDLVHHAFNLKVAKVKERNNTISGYYVSLKSENGGNLEREGNRLAAALNRVPYWASYDGKSVQLSKQDVVIYSSRHFNLEAQSRRADFDISYRGQDADEKLAGKYSDTLTFTITAR